MRASLSTEKHVALAVWKHITPNCYRSVADHSGVGRSAVGEVVTEAWSAIESMLLCPLIKPGHAQEGGDGSAWLGLLNYTEATDETHILSLCPPHQASTQRGVSPGCYKAWLVTGAGSLNSFGIVCKGSWGQESQPGCGLGPYLHNFPFLCSV